MSRKTDVLIGTVAVAALGLGLGACSHPLTASPGSYKTWYSNGIEFAAGDLAAQVNNHGTYPETAGAWCANVLSLSQAQAIETVLPHDALEASNANPVGAWINGCKDGWNEAQGAIAANQSNPVTQTPAASPPAGLSFTCIVTGSGVTLVATDTSQLAPQPTGGYPVTIAITDNGMAVSNNTTSVKISTVPATINVGLPSPGTTNPLSCTAISGDHLYVAP